MATIWPEPTPDRISSAQIRATQGPYEAGTCRVRHNVGQARPHDWPSPALTLSEPRHVGQNRANLTRNPSPPVRAWSSSARTWSKLAGSGPNLAEQGRFGPNAVQTWAICLGSRAKFDPCRSKLPSFVDGGPNIGGARPNSSILGQNLAESAPLGDFDRSWACYEQTLASVPRNCAALVPER